MFLGIPRPELNKLSFVSLLGFPVFLNKGKPDLLHPCNFTEKPPSGMNSASLRNMCSLFKNHLKIVLKQVRKNILTFPSCFMWQAQFEAIFLLIFTWIRVDVLLCNCRMYFTPEFFLVQNCNAAIAFVRKA